MSQRSWEKFGAYRKARELIVPGVADTKLAQREPLCSKLLSPQGATADSTRTDIGEDLGRLSRAEYMPFLDFAQGSARETRGHDLRTAIRPGDDWTRQRTAPADEFIGILTATTGRLRIPSGPDNPATLRREATDYGY